MITRNAVPQLRTSVSSCTAAPAMSAVFTVAVADMRRDRISAMMMMTTMPK